MYAEILYTGCYLVPFLNQNPICMNAPLAVQVPTKAELTNTFTFIKEENRWFITLPEYLRKSYGRMSELVEGAQTMLNTVARGMNCICLKLDTEPFEGADRMELVQHCEAPRGGAYYIMNTCNGRPINKKMWICDLNLFVFGDMPQGIYFRKLNEAS